MVGQGSRLYFMPTEPRLNGNAAPLWYTAVLVGNVGLVGGLHWPVRLRGIRPERP